MSEELTNITLAANDMAREIKQLREELAQAVRHRDHWHGEVKCADARIAELTAELAQAKDMAESHRQNAYKQGDLAARRLERARRAELQRDHIAAELDELKQQTSPAAVPVPDETGEEYPGELAHLRDLLRGVGRLADKRPEGDPLTELLIDHYSDSRMVDAQLAKASPCHVNVTGHRMVNGHCLYCAKSQAEVQS